jgi:formylglycine-generating enzyme required for sulfatase activity
MAGNVEEMVADWYSPTYYQGSPKDNPSGPDSGELRVTRGGSWGSAIPSVQVFSRISWDPTYENAEVGFRCAVSP